MQIIRTLPGVASGPRSSARDTSDDALVGLIARSDRDAMRLLFARHGAKVFRFLMRIVDNDAMADDLVSEVFIDVWRHAGRFEGRSQVTTWLLGIARHKAMSALRRRSTDELDQGMLESIEDPADNPEVAVQKHETGAILADCLRQLSPAHREIVDLVYYHGRSIADVAEIIGVPLSTVKTRMFYARKRIAELMTARGVVPAFG
jgi:RNA polymerase sigma-70 factor (ECF subfamily)